MSKWTTLLCLCMLLLSLVGSTVAQTTNTFPSSGNVGIGTTNPIALLNVQGGNVLVGTPSAPQNIQLGGSELIYFNTYAPAATSGQIIGGMGFIGLGASHGQLDYRGGKGFEFLDVSADGPSATHAASAYAPIYSGNLDVLASGGRDLLLGGGSATGSEIKFMYPGVAHFSIYNSGNGNLTIANTGAQGLTNTVGGSLMVISSGGNVGIGTTVPTYKLHVAGQMYVSGGIVFPDGKVQNTAFDTTLCGGDYAESVDVTGDRSRYEPGDILVIAPDRPGRFLKSAEPYSTFVTGIYSTKPGTIGRRQTAPKSPDEIPMAMIGIVPTKVSAENGAIRVGDLLVTSSTPGHAMKGTDRSRMLGAVIGKALGNLESERGIIEVVVTLQ